MKDIKKFLNIGKKELEELKKKEAPLAKKYKRWNHDFYRKQMRKMQREGIRR